MLRLDAINRVLTSAQIQPVASLTSPDSLVSKAITFVDNVTLRVCEQGWDFNQDYDWPLTPVSNQIPVPTVAAGFTWDALNVDVRPENSEGKDIVVRDGKLWNKTDRTFTFIRVTPLYVDITWDIDFDNLPLVAQEYIVACASVQFISHVAVDPETAKALRAEEARAWFLLKQRDTQQSSASVLNRHPINQLQSLWPVVRR